MMSNALMKTPSPPSDAAKSYDAWHARLEQDAGGSSPWHGLALRYLDPGRDVSDRDVLEIGCGRGGFAARLAAMSPPPRSLVGADFSSVAIDLAARTFSASGLASILRWDVQDITALTYSSGAFDTVVSCETIEHVNRPEIAIKELARVLRPGGKLILTTPSYLGLLGLYRGYLRVVGRRFTEAGQPINKFTLIPRTAGWIRGAGLKLTQWNAIGHYIPFPRRPPIALPLDSVRLLRLLGLHSVFVAMKPS
jgi:2-polyprenyl-3-methyl-5-hydroxy-6-metoxy-1,4-benzoquinol methylase